MLASLPTFAPLRHCWRLTKVETGLIRQLGRDWRRSVRRAKTRGKVIIFTNLQVLAVESPTTSFLQAPMASPIRQTMIGAKNEEPGDPAFR